MNLKKYLSIILWLIVTPSISVKAQTKQVGYTLNCTFAGLPDKTKAYLVTQENDTVQYTLSNGNQITFKGSLKPDGRFHFIRLDTLVSDVVSKAIFVSNKSIVVKGALGKREVEVTNSPEQAEYEEATTTLSKDFFRKINESQKEINFKANNIRADSSLTKAQRDFELEKAGDEWRKYNNSVNTEFSILLKKWLLDHKISLFAPWVMQGYFGYMSPEYIREVWAAFSPKTKESYYGKLLKLDIEASAIVKGSTIPDFPLKNREGKTEGLHELIKKNKYTLIDCWASWCKPCRAEVPKLKIVYEKYKDKGLNILGISSDKREGDWKKAIAEDKTSWNHVLEVDGNLSKALSIGAIPAYILVNDEGKLVAFDCPASSIKNFGGGLKGEELEKKLEELLGK